METMKKDDFLIISVESRKGGVGKTTAALNLAALLLNRGYSVLLIDMDITGTNLSDAVQSPFWKNLVNPIKQSNENKEIFPVNLLSLFNEKFMNGDPIPDWTSNPNADFFISDSKINLFGSQLYNDSKSNKKPDEKSKLICNPSILFDELHAHWLVEFLKEICSSYSENVNKKTAVVLDNSPGFIGISPAIQDWLTDIGPKRGKFLTVSSLDVQDLISCADTMDLLHEQFVKKVTTATIFDKISKSESNEEISMKGISKDFFIRLASQTTDKDIENCYNKSLPELNGYVKNPSKYHAIVINKVPKEITKGTFSYNFFNILNRSNNSSIAEKIFLGNKSSNIRKLFINYDEYIEYQFLRPSLNKNESRYYREKMNYEVLDISFKNILNKLSNINFPDFKDNASNMSYRQISNAFSKYQNIFSDTIDRLEGYNRYNISKLINSEWYPEYPIRTVKSLLNDILFSIEYPYEKYEMFDEIREKMNEDFIHIFIPHLKERLMMRNEIFNEQLLNSLYLVAFLSIRTTREFPRYTDYIIEIVSLISNIQQTRWAKQQENKNLKAITMFLAGENVNREELRKFEIDDKFMHFFHKFKIHPEIRETFFSDLYSAFCYAQARVIDLKNDLHFMLRVLRDSIHKEHNEEILFPAIRELLDNVIVNKTISHNESVIHLSKEISSASYMTKFQFVLAYAIKDWEI